MLLDCSLHTDPLGHSKIDGPNTGKVCLRFGAGHWRSLQTYILFALLFIYAWYKLNFLWATYGYQCGRSMGTGTGIANRTIYSKGLQLYTLHKVYICILKFSTSAYRVVVSTDHIRLNTWPSNYLFTP